MTCKANSQHLRLINRLKMIEEYKGDGISIDIETWSYKSETRETRVTMWSTDKSDHIFKGSTISELERFINSEREKAGLFKARAVKLKGGKE